MSPMAAEPIEEPVPGATVLKTKTNGAVPHSHPQSTLISEQASQASQTLQVPIAQELCDLYAERIAAKLWKVSGDYLPKDKDAVIENFPEHVPDNDGPSSGRYATREARFWTCGFFPGSLWALFERCVRYPRALPVPEGMSRSEFHAQLLARCRSWAEPLLPMAHRKNTHDMGFITQPALRVAWELTGDTRARDALVTAAYSLATRYVPDLKAVRSWDQSLSRRYEITDQGSNFLVIVDSMCNLDLLFYIGHHTGDQRLIEISTDHARFVAQHLVRPDGSTWHVVNLDPRTGEIQTKYTHQGWADDSTWARGQAWAILGFAQTYLWTREVEFLDMAVRVANRFLSHMQQASYAYPFVAPWDFDAPFPQGKDEPQRDTSAAMIAANGLLVLHNALQPSRQSPYLDYAIRIARETCEMAMKGDRARFVVGGGAEKENGNGVEDGKKGEKDGKDKMLTVEGASFDAIITHATANNNPYALVRYGDHGLVYADYYFMEFGNKLLRMGLV